MESHNSITLAKGRSCNKYDRPNNVHHKIIRHKAINLEYANHTWANVQTLVLNQKIS